MVMKRNMMAKNLQRAILRSFGRYIAILAIIALGCSIFIGLKVTKTDMIQTGQEYTQAQNMFDLRLLNTYGWTEEEVKAIASLAGVEDAEGSIYLDAFASVDDGDQSVFRIHALPERINKVYLLSGRMPQSADECLVDGEHFTSDVIGQEIVISDTNDADTLDSLNQHTYTIVGCVSSPLYMDMTRGSTSLGSGSISHYVYVPQEAFDADYYTEIFVTMGGQWKIYSEAHNDALDRFAEDLEADVALLAQQRFDTLLAEAEDAYAEGLAEYEDGLLEFEEGKQEALQGLEDALKKLQDGQAELDEAWEVITAGEPELLAAQQQIDDAKAQLDAGALELAQQKAEAYRQIADAFAELQENEKAVKENLALVNDGLAQIDDGVAQIDDGLAQIEENLPMLELAISLAEAQVNSTRQALEIAKLFGNADRIASLEATLAEQTAKLEEYQTQLEQATQMRTELTATRVELVAQRQELAENQKTLLDAQAAITAGYTELESQEKTAQKQFAAAEAKIDASYLELAGGQAELDAKKAELDAGKAELSAAQAELDAGWAEYESGKAQVDAELAEAEQKLADAAVELEEARQTIDDMDAPDSFALTRNTNAGYVALDSNSNIVSGVAKVLPAFFLLIAALVCITTMTRMVEEERTQIGTLKALGYSNLAIMGKYLLYSSSAALIGCGIGIAIGSTFFPNLLWNAYGIIFNIRPNVSLVFDWQLSLGITVAYLAVSTLVTWYCCRRTLRDVPAELIRPKAPEAGKKILLERLPFWKKLSFLNKVMLRNTVRYRQRLLMMLIGIGGCTALLLTGFGMRDTIVDLANIQFETVNHFDLEIYFDEGQTEEDQKDFIKYLKTEKIASNAGFFYQTSVELEYDDAARELFLISSGSDIREYMTFSRNGEDLGMPAEGEAFLSIGAAEIMGISVGDTVTVRNSDLQTLTLTISGIYENHVNNYIIVSPDTLQQQWGSTPEEQMAFLMVRDDADVHEAAALLSERDGIINITICQDSADMVESMMDALNMVLSVVILSAGVLGAIVLYNLTNININERIREIATIKVLGFNAAETSAYIFKENLLLTALGTGFGLFLGRAFLEFVMFNIKVDFVWFKTRLTPLSYVLAVVLTILCALLVDFVFHFKLQKINMAEALKSVE